jgi:hypothetical protein
MVLECGNVWCLIQNNMDECGSVWLWKCFAANIAATFDQSVFVFALKKPSVETML